MDTLWIFETDTLKTMYADAVRIAAKHGDAQPIADAIKNELQARGELPREAGWLPR